MMPPAKAIERLSNARKTWLAFRTEFPEFYPNDILRMDSLYASSAARESMSLAVSALFEDRDFKGFFEWTHNCGLASLAAARNRDPERHQEYWGPIFLRRVVVVLAGAHFDLAKAVSKAVLRPIPQEGATDGLEFQRVLAPAWVDLAEELWSDLHVSSSKAFSYLREEEPDRTGVPLAMLALCHGTKGSFQDAITVTLRDHRRLCSGRRDYAKSPDDHLICWEAVALLQVAMRRDMRLEIFDPLVPVEVLRK